MRRSATEMILHILRRVDWESALERGIYTPASLATEGFIHCSTAQQILDTANRFYRGQEGLVVLCIDESRLETLPRYEPPTFALDDAPSGLFPHLYGPLNLDAVIRVVKFPSCADGTFKLPAALAELCGFRPDFRSPQDAGSSGYRRRPIRQRGRRRRPGDL
jgi:uncharacterized protein (DUF952 family)